MLRFLAPLLSVFFLFTNVSHAKIANAAFKYTINGYVKDSLSGESISDATITINGYTKQIASNQYGFYSLTLDEGSYEISITHISYQAKSFRVTLDKNFQFNVDLIPKSASISEVVIFSKKQDANVKNAQMGKVDLFITQIKNIPVLMGEVDILRAIQLLPGVQNAGEGNAGFYVRGGGPDQNLILLDDAVVYNTGHLFGFFSIFNADAIKNTTLIKGSMPAQYGGRLSSVLDIAMKEGNMNKIQVDGGISIIASRFSIQGPIKKNKASFIVSARRTYIDAIVKPFIPESNGFHGSGYYFYDFNAKANYRFSDKDRLYLSGYFGRDVFDFVNDKRSFSSKIPWGNSTTTLRWNHVINKKLFANTTAVYNDYKFKFSATQNDFSLTLSSGIRDGSLKMDFDYYPALQHKVKFGGIYTYHKFIPNVLSGHQDTTEFKPNNEGVKYASEAAAYVQDDWDISNKLKINYGLRWSSFTQIGPYVKFTKDAHGNKQDSTEYGSFDKIISYGGLEPRAAIRYSLNDKMSIKVAISRNYQYIHLVSNSGNTLPTDLWVPSTYVVQPQLSWQYSAGIFKNFLNNKYETSLEVYYKNMKNQVDYREGYTPSLTDPENEFVFGKGWSYGAELFINKTKGKLSGWVGYTLSWTWRKFEDLNGNKKFPAKYNRRHDMSIVANYELNSKWKLGAVFVYGTGNTTTMPEQFYFVNGVLMQEYSAINQYRLAAYHRLDFSATYTPVPKRIKRIKSSWVFSIYNTYSRMNPYFIYFDRKGSLAGENLTIQAKQVSLFPILPAITWNFKF